MCTRCKSFVLDYLLVPSIKGDPFYTHVREEYLQKAGPKLAHEFFHFLERITPSQAYMIENHTRLIQKDLEKSRQDPLLKKGVALYAAAEKTLKGEMDVLLTLVEDCHILKKSMRAEAWLGTVMYFLWTNLRQIHTEHERNATCSYAGPAMGMRSYQLPIIAEDTRTQEQKEFDELYN